MLVNRFPAKTSTYLPVWAVSAVSITILFCFVGLIIRGASAVRSDVSVIAPIAGGMFTLQGTGFGPNAVYSSTNSADVPDGITLFGSWLFGSDASEGSVVSSWLEPVEHFSMMVAGYPTKAGMLLQVEVAYATGPLSVFDVATVDPRERWTQVNITLPQGRPFERFRIRAIDRSQVNGGWLGFSEPFVLACGDRPVRTSADLILEWIGAMLPWRW